jgi:hypothetical protein
MVQTGTAEDLNTSYPSYPRIPGVKTVTKKIKTFLEAIFKKI